MAITRALEMYVPICKHIISTSKVSQSAWRFDAHELVTVGVGDIPISIPCHALPAAADEAEASAVLPPAAAPVAAVPSCVQPCRPEKGASADCPCGFSIPSGGSGLARTSDTTVATSLSWRLFKVAFFSVGGRHGQGRGGRNTNTGRRCWADSG